MPLGAFRINTLAKTSAVVVGPFTEAIRTPISLLAGGGANISTTESKFGGSSAYFDASGDSINCNKPLLPTTGDFTIEYWLNQTTLAANRDHWQQYASGVTGRATGYTSQTTGVVNFFVDPDVTIASTDTISAGVWHHIAMQRNGTTFELFLDGVSQGTATSSTSVYQGGNFIIGLGPWSDAYGYMDEFRISNIARYSSGFTPSTTAFTHDQYTELLLHADGTNDLTTFVDDTGDRERVGLSAIGNAQISTTQSKFGTSSIIFDGTGDGINCNKPLLPATADWTVEMWVYPTSIVGLDYFFTQYSLGASGRTGMYHTSGGNIGLFINGGISYTTTGTISANTWQHLAWVRNGSTFKTYINGSEDPTSGTASPSIQQIASIVGKINSSGGTDDFIGHMDEIRVSDTARYTSGFSVPTERFVSDENTLLLIHGVGTGGSTFFLDDNSSARAPMSIRPIGNTSISTTQSKFGGTSASLDGTGDYFIIKDEGNKFDFGTGDFTIEWFQYLTALDRFAIDFRAGSSALTKILIYSYPADGTADDLYFYNTANRITALNCISANTWQHIVVQRESGVTRLFVDGAQVGSDYADTNSYAHTEMRIWHNSIGAENYTPPGYIDEFRVSSVARYTGTSYTVPTQPFKNDENTIMLMHADGTVGQTDFLDDNSAFFQ